MLSWIFKQPRWANLGLGLGVGIGLHIALDLVLWFNGVELLWPLGGWVNFWETIKPPEWFARLMDPAEFLFFALFFGWLWQISRSQNAETKNQAYLRYWMIAMLVLFAIFTPLAYIMTKGFLTIFGVFYLICLTAAFLITIQSRRLVEQSV